MLTPYLDPLPLIAILRGVRPSEVAGIGEALYEAGFRGIEVPLNSPDPFESVRTLARTMPADCIVGAGTVVCVDDVARVEEAGGRLIVTPNTDPDVIRASVAANMVVAPGVATPTDAFAAIHAGAKWLKLFPASTYGLAHLRALKAVLPNEIGLLAVGGVGATNLAEWRAAGAIGFGIASELYRPGDTATQVGAHARELRTACGL